MTEQSRLAIEDKASSANTQPKIMSEATELKKQGVTYSDKGDCVQAEEFYLKAL
eukprot:CAMPEP_0204896934 /NCGR_PEP_ID=MMETSP1397-20131031/454_1 /ASSEMBLY_ACC=CAM_ASM_000891 /TAXON_ID=49980 /ORGANISM="Climacostomum Climacostomum virens, Strain Stock W-24" /LENGTH=53 /DNA_ID=CAMNT_0052064621 /DNA_START=437 /DNA_END=599 /DNA_ORIENTATION=-